MSAINPLEHDEQKCLIKWADIWKVPGTSIVIGDYLFSIPNGGQRHKATAVKLKAEGARAGIPDLMLALPIHGHPGMFLEMKRRKGSSTSPEQKQKIELLRGAGYIVKICRGWDCARNEIISYVMNQKQEEKA